MMNLLHFCYGAVSFFGPRFMGYMVDSAGLRWQDVYPLTLVPAFILLGVTLAIRFPSNESTLGGTNEGAAVSKERPSFWVILKDPMVWLFGFIIGISGGLEAGAAAWSGLFLQDVYGLDPSTSGAFFISIFYVLYTISRFSSGFIMEKTGYMRSIIISVFIITVLFIFAFGLGRRGIYLLPVTGFFIAILWPTSLAISVGVFRERAQLASSAIIPIAFTVNGIMQYTYGLFNRFIGPAWGYRSCLLYCAILMALLLVLRRRTRAAK
jgi:fucose permease